MATQLRVHTHGTDPLLSQLRLARALSTVGLNPARLPPSAILCIKKFCDPLPGKLSLQSIGALLPRVWEAAVIASLEQLAKQALRPAHGPVPPSADAVLFADEGEMLACLALDMTLGRAAGLWWWRGILRSLPSSSSAGLSALLCSRGSCVPAALHHLAKRGEAMTVVKALSAEEAKAVLSAVNRAYGLRDFHLPMPDLSWRERGHGWTDHPLEFPGSKSEGHQLQGPTKISGFVAPVQVNQPPGSVPGSREAPMDLRAAVLPGAAGPAPWDRWLPPGLIPFSLGKERACLLGLGLSLYHAPAVVRSDAFLTSLRTWWAAPRAGLPPATDRPMKRLPPPTPRGDHLRKRPDAQVTIASPSPDRVSERLSPHPAFLGPQAALEDSPKVAQPSVAAKRSESGHPATASPGRHQVHKIEPHQALSSELTRQLDLGPEGPAPLIVGTAPGAQALRDPQAEAVPVGEAHQAVSTEAALLLEGGLDTQLGGVLYLINLMLRLDLPACFEQDWGLASRVGTWGVLETLGRGLLNEDGRALGDDPLWTALAKLDGRESGDLPGKDFRGSGPFRLPAKWQAQIANSAGEPFDEVEVATLTGTLAAGLNSHLACWLSFVLPYIRFRLQRAFDPNRTETLDLQTALLLRQGRLYVTSTHVDLVMRLMDVSTPIRMAGLDCNPGWLPDFGRVVLFHFE